MYSSSYMDAENLMAFIQQVLDIKQYGVTGGMGKFIPP